MSEAQSYSTGDMSGLCPSFGLRALWSLTSVCLLTVSIWTLSLLKVTNK
jgi:hypothetical protein